MTSRNTLVQEHIISHVKSCSDTEKLILTLQKALLICSKIKFGQTHPMLITVSPGAL